MLDCRTIENLYITATYLFYCNSSAFRDELIFKQHVAAGIDVHYQPLSRYATLFSIMAVPAKGVSLVDLQRAIMVQLKVLQTTPVSQAELSRVHQLMQAGYWFAKDSLLSQARFLGSIAMHQQPPTTNPLSGLPQAFAGGYADANPNGGTTLSDPQKQYCWWLQPCAKE